MEIRKFIVCITAIGITVLSLSSVMLYSMVSSNARQIMLFLLIVVSAWTSFFGVMWALYGVYSFRGTIDQAQREIDDRLRGHYGPFFEMVRRVDERLDGMSDGEKELLARRFEAFVDRLIETRDREENPLLAGGES